MRIAIMADDADSFIRPLSQGFQRMLEKAGIESKIFYDGLEFLDCRDPDLSIKTGTATSFVRSVRNRLYHPQSRFIKKFWKELEAFDVMVVVHHMPTAFLNYHLARIEEVRIRRPNMPIILYDLIYLSTVGEWIDFLKNGNDYHGFIKGKNHFGLERYDWYLVCSASTDYPMPKGFQPISLVGCNMEDDTLYPEQTEFRALIDFERPNHMQERAIQILALQKTNTPYTVLHGRYPMAEIRKIYRQSSIYFLAHLEAFGFPICEVQACGGLVFTPYAQWAWAHYQKSDLTVPGGAALSENFRVYDNSLDKLCEMIEESKASFNANQNRSVYLANDSRFLKGNQYALEEFLLKLQQGEVNSKNHLEYEKLNDLIKKP